MIPGVITGMHAIVFSPQAEQVPSGIMRPPSSACSNNRGGPSAA